jgi:phosphohistidine phosphatase
VTRTLSILRHAKSSWDDPSLPDHERPLAPRGLRATKRLAAHLIEIGCDPELVLCSDAVRTRATLERVQSAFTAPTVQIEEALYGATADRLLARLRDVPDRVQSVLLIGHNPGVQELVADLAGEDLDFPTAALATLTFDGGWDQLAPGVAALAGYVTPKLLR